MPPKGIPPNLTTAAREGGFLELAELANLELSDVYHRHDLMKPTENVNTECFHPEPEKGTRRWPYRLRKDRIFEIEESKTQHLLFSNCRFEVMLS